MVVDVNKLKEKIRQNRYTINSFAKKMGMDQSTFYRKLKANGDTFMVKELYNIMDILQLNKIEAQEIFFSNNSHLCDKIERD